MKVLFHKEKDFEDKYSKQKVGLLILEAEPSTRTCYVPNSIKYNRQFNFPYIQFVIGYLFNGKNYKFLNIHERGLRLYFSPSPLKSFDSKEVYVPWTDWVRNGVVCMDHRDDGKRFEDLNSLVNAIFSNYWSLSLDKNEEVFKILENLDKNTICQDSVLKDIDSTCSRFYSRVAQQKISLIEAFDKYCDIGARPIVEHYPSLEGQSLLNGHWSKDWKLPAENYVANSILNLQNAIKF